MKKQWYGNTTDGAQIDLYTLTNDLGMEVGVITYGAIVTSLRVPDAAGTVDDVVLGFDTPDGYLGSHPYFGAVVGRYANRIANGRFMIGGVEFVLAVNQGDNSLHGGLKGFDKQVWTAKTRGSSLELTYVSKDGEEGYPGTLRSTVTYTVTSLNELRIDYVARADRDTIINLSNHSYFNLGGFGNKDILGHVLTIDADRFTPVGSDLIPTGELRSVEGTAFDFRKPAAIGDRINSAEDQIFYGKGYDHNYVLNNAGRTSVASITVIEPECGRVMQVFTSEPGVQFYTGNFLDGKLVGKGGRYYAKHAGFCLETQHFPDSPNQKIFPSTILKAGMFYKSTSIYKFTIASRLKRSFRNQSLR